jgi:hypothetical protein
MKIKAEGAIPAAVRVGECVYCGSKTNLTKEHIVPYGLGCPSEWVLHEGSCQACAKITSAFERDVLKEYFRDPRATLGLPSYRPKYRPESVDLQLLKGRESLAVSLPVGECPTLIIMPHLKVPACMGKYDYQTGVRVTGSSLHGPSNMIERLARFGATGYSVRSKGVLVSFARMLAKIAYGMAVLQFGRRALNEVFVLPSILDPDADVGRWVGCSGEPAVIPEADKLLHKIEVMTNGTTVSAQIRLFANYMTPVYLVFVGSLNRVGSAE